MKHYAIEGISLSIKGSWVKRLLKGHDCGIKELIDKKGLLFSTITLEDMIDDEIRHDRFLLSKDLSRSIRTFSSGEQRKALLEYLFEQKPDFLVLDNPFDCLDAESVEFLKVKLTLISKEMPLIQIFKRRSDILPFITNALLVENDDFKRAYSIKEFNQYHLHKESAFFKGAVPSPLAFFKDIPDVLIKLNGISVSYGDRCVLKNISWQINKGDFWHLKGPNGSGKTTLLSMIYGDNPKAFGLDIDLFGQRKGSGESVWDIKEKIGYFTPSMTELFQSGHTAEQMVISGLVDSVGLYLKPSDSQRDLAQKWLKTLHLLHKKEERFCRLSQVNQRMVLIARAMIKHPPLLILDEPSTGLDDVHASIMVLLIQKIAKESNTAIIYVSHRNEEGLKPDFCFELELREGGSIRKIQEQALRP